MTALVSRGAQKLT